MKLIIETLKRYWLLLLITFVVEAALMTNWQEEETIVFGMKLLKPSSIVSILTGLLAVFIVLIYMTDKETKNNDRKGEE